MGGTDNWFMQQIRSVVMALGVGVTIAWYEGSGWSAARAGDAPLFVDDSKVYATDCPVSGSTNDPVAKRIASTRLSLESEEPLTEGLFTRRYGRLVLEDVREVFTAPIHWRKREWLGVAAAGTVIAGITFADRRLQRTFAGDQQGTGTKVAKEIAPLGTYYSAGILGGFYLGGLAFHDARARAVAQDGLAASLITSGMVVPLGKIIFGRPRPYSKDEPGDFEFFRLKDDSFPSGHTAQAFTVASVIASHYYHDHPWVSIVSYGAASAVGWARVQQGSHFASEVVAGAVVGTFVGCTVVHHNRTRRQEESASTPGKVRVIPFHAGSATGLALSWDF